MRPGSRCTCHAQRSLSRCGGRLPEGAHGSCERQLQLLASRGRRTVRLSAPPRGHLPQVIRPEVRRRPSSRLSRPVDLGGRRQRCAGSARVDRTGRRAGAGAYRSRDHTVPRRRDDGVHRRDDGAAQGRHVASGRHVCRVDEWRGSRVRRRDSRQGPPWRAALVRCFTLDACGRNVDGVCRTSQRPASGAVRPRRNSTRLRFSRPRSARRSA